MKNNYSNIFTFNRKILSKTINFLNNGNIAGLPTETVYGLGGNAYSKLSIKKIFKLNLVKIGLNFLVNWSIFINLARHYNA